MCSVTSFQIGAVCSVDYVNRYGDLVFTSKAMNELQNDSMKTKSSATAETARDADDVDFKHSRSLKAIRCCTNRRGTYDFLLALNSNSRPTV